MAPRADDADSSKGNSMADRDKKNGLYTQRQYQAREYKPASQGYQPKATRYNTLGNKPDKPRQAPKPAPKRERKHRPMRKYYQLNKCYVMMSENKVTQYKHRPYRPAPHQPTYRQRPLRPVDQSMDRKPYRSRGYYRLNSVNFGYAFVTRPYDREPLTAKLPSQMGKEDRPRTATSHRSVATPEKVRVHEDTGPAHVPTGGVAVLPPVLTAAPKPAPKSKPQPAPRPLPAPRPARDLSTKTRDKNGFYKAREYQYTERRFRWDTHKNPREYRYRDPDYYFVYDNYKPIGQRIERRDRNTSRTIKPRPEKREKAQAPVVAAAARPVDAARPPRRDPTPKEPVQRVEESPEPEPHYMMATPAIMPETPREVYRAPEPKKEYFSPSPEPLPPVVPVARVPEPRRQRTPTPKLPTRTPSPIRTPTPTPRAATPKRASPVPSPRRASPKHSGGGNTAAIAAAVIGGAAVGAVGAAAVAQSTPARQPTPKPRRKTPPPPSPPPPAAAPVVAAAAVGAAVGVAAAASPPPPAKTAPPPPAANPETKPSSKPAKNKKPFVPVAAVVVDASPKAAQPPPPAPQKPPAPAPSRAPHPAPEVPTARPSPPPIVMVAAPAPAAAVPKSRPPPAAKAPPAPPVQKPAAGPAALGSILRTMEMFA